MDKRLDWLLVVQRLRRVAEAGLAYSENPYDRERYTQLVRLASEVAAAGTDTSVDVIEEILKAERGYPTPKVDVRAVVPRDGKILLVKEAADGRWALPGGWADVGETASEVTVREVFEETGFTVRAVKLVALFDKSRHEHPKDIWWTYKAIFRCELSGGDPRPSHETLEVGFFAENDLPPLSLERTTPGQLDRMFVHLRNPDLPTDFD